MLTVMARVGRFLRALDFLNNSEVGSIAIWRREEVGIQTASVQPEHGCQTSLAIAPMLVFVAFRYLRPHCEYGGFSGSFVCELLRRDKGMSTAIPAAFLRTAIPTIMAIERGERLGWKLGLGTDFEEVAWFHNENPLMMIASPMLTYS
jgi:hypothetical protein